MAAMHAQPAARVVAGAPLPPKPLTGEAGEVGPLSACTVSSLIRGSTRVAQIPINATARNVVANSNGSVIGVLCRYSTAGFSISSAAAATPPAIEPDAR